MNNDVQDGGKPTNAARIYCTDVLASVYRLQHRNFSQPGRLVARLHMHSTRARSVRVIAELTRCRGCCSIGLLYMICAQVQSPALLKTLPTHTHIWFLLEGISTELALPYAFVFGCLHVCCGKASATCRAISFFKQASLRHQEEDKNFGRIAAARENGGRVMRFCIRPYAHTQQKITVE